MNTYKIALAMILLGVATGCEEWDWEGIGGCNGGEGFVEQICSGSTWQGGALEIEVELDADWDYVEWTLEYDRSSNYLYGEHTSTPYGLIDQVNTPGVISEGNLYVYATAKDWDGKSKSLFTVSNRADRADNDGEDGEDQISAERSITVLNNNLPVDWSTRMTGGRGRLTIQLSDYLNN